jgi:hypothetical protein
MKYLFCIASYKDQRQQHFVGYHSPRNKVYCNHHGFEYIEMTDLSHLADDCKQRTMVWWRFFLIRKWIEIGFLKPGDIVSQIDADICIVNGKLPLEPSEGKDFAYAIDSCNTHCMGVFSLRVTDWTKEMLNNLLDEKRYQKYIKTPFWQMFQEQACWYSLAGIKGIFADPKQPGWNTIKDLGWNSTKENEPIYTTKELKQHVEILPVEWNVTDWAKQSPYFRIPTKTENADDVIFRHFAGTKNWESIWASKPVIF